jgi:uncharacterized membrane protein YbhN (UPF0104 family)
MADSGVFARLTRAPDAAALWWHIAGGALIYGASVGLLAMAWHGLLRALGVADLPPSRSAGIYAASQFGKYFPGSVLQYVGRHALLRKAGLSHRALVLCAVLEAAMLVAAALVWAAPMAVHYVPVDAPVIWAVIVVALGFVGWMLRRHATTLGGGIRVSLPWLGVAFASYLVFFGMMGLTFDVVAAFSSSSIPWATRYAAVAASWIAGFVIVGAPAGVGVREAVFLALIGGLMGADTTLVAVSAFRLATFGGDLLAFLAGWPVVAAARRERAA